MKACNQCGKCCLGTLGDLGVASTADIARFAKYGRHDVLGWLSFMPYIDPPLADMWLSPTTGEEAERCPWLRKLPRQEKYNCRINECKPDVCRRFPIDSDQMFRIGCEMLEPGDENRPRADLDAELETLRDATMLGGLAIRP